MTEFAGKDRYQGPLSQIEDRHFDLAFEEIAFFGRPNQAKMHFFESDTIGYFDYLDDLKDDGYDATIARARQLMAELGTPEDQHDTYLAGLAQGLLIDRRSSQLQERCTFVPTPDYHIAFALARVINTNMDALSELDVESSVDPFSDTQDIFHKKRIDAANMMAQILLPDRPR